MVAVDLLPESVTPYVDPERKHEIFADPMLMMVMYNFFDNAMRHGDHVTEIAVRFTDDEKSGTLIVEDNGIGVPADLKEQIFERGFGNNSGSGLFLIREILAITGVIHQGNRDGRKGCPF